MNFPARDKRCTEADLICPADARFAEAAAVLRASVAHLSPQDAVDEFIAVIESLPVTATQRHVTESDMREAALADVEGAMAAYQIAVAVAESRCVSSHRDFLRQFRDLKKWPTRQRLKNILERDRDESNLKTAESAIRFALVRLGVFGEDVPPDWIEELGGRPDHLRKVAEAVCEYFAYKLDRHGRPRDIAREEYANRLVQLYEGLTGRPITYAKATDTSPERKAGEPYGVGLEFLLAALRLIEQTCTPYQAAAQIERIRTAYRA